jgi:hypothetical protein
MGCCIDSNQVRKPYDPNNPQNYNGSYMGNGGDTFMYGGGYPYYQNHNNDIINNDNNNSLDFG